MKINVNIIEISEIRLQNEKEPTINISLPNYVYEHTPIESGKGETVLYIDKTPQVLNIFEKMIIESTFTEILNKKKSDNWICLFKCLHKSLITGCISILNSKLKTSQIIT